MSFSLETGLSAVNGATVPVSNEFDDAIVMQNIKTLTKHIWNSLFDFIFDNR